MPRQPQNTEHEWELAEAWIKNAGWTDVEFERAGTLNPENVSGAADYLIRAFESALAEEFGFVVYEEVLSSGGRDWVGT